MNSEGTPNRELRFSTRAKEFFESLSGADQERLDALLDIILENPAVDGRAIFDLPVPPAMWRVLVEDEFTIYFRPVTKLDQNPPVTEIQIDAMKRTLLTIRDMLRYPF